MPQILRDFPAIGAGPAAATLLAIALLLVACGSSDSGASSNDSAPEPEAEVRNAEGKAGLEEDRIITRVESSFTMDDLVGVGYKKSKEFSTETLPEALEVWYGFFNQKDIEVRVYETHAAALEFGVDPAEAAIAKEAGQTDYLIPVVNRYPAYAIVGNIVMLCERQLDTCTALIDRLP